MSTEGKEPEDEDPHKSFMDTSRLLINSTQKKIEHVTKLSSEVSHLASLIKDERGHLKKKQHMKDGHKLSVPTHFVEKPKKKEVPQYINKFKKLSDDNKFKLIEDTLLKMKEADSLAASENVKEENDNNNFKPVKIPMVENTDAHEDKERTKYHNQEIHTPSRQEYVGDEKTKNVCYIPGAMSAIDKQTNSKQNACLCGEHNCEPTENSNVATRLSQQSSTCTHSSKRSLVKRHCCVKDSYTGPAYLDDENERHLHLPALRTRKSLTARSRPRGKPNDSYDSETSSTKSTSDSREIESRIRDEIKRHLEKLKIQKKWKNKVDCVQDFIKHQHRTWAKREVFQPKKITLLASDMPPFISSGKAVPRQEMTPEFRVRLRSSTITQGSYHSIADRTYSRFY